MAGFGTPAIDGTLDAAYGAAVSVQTVRTAFGSSTNGNLIGGGGSELNGLYLANNGSTLFVLLTGNVESNGNTLYILIDDVSNAAGPNVLPNTPGKDDLFNTNKLGGATMPVGFGPEWGFVFKGFMNGAIGGPSDYDYVYSIANFVTGTSVAPALDQPTLALVNPATGTDSTAGYPITFALDNSNVAGVNGGINPDWAIVAETPATVTTGYEIAIPLSAIVPATTGNLKILAYISSGDGTFAANQFLPPLVPAIGNVGNPPPGGYLFPTLGLTAASYSLVVPMSAPSWNLYE